MQQVVVTNQTRALSQPVKAGYCNTFFTRLKGLMFQKRVGSYSGLLFAYDRDSRLDSAIHMFFVGFDISAIWIDSEGKVVDTCLAKRWRPFYMPSRPARYILETHPHRLVEFQVGDRISFESV
jgi:uncharacterized membrane protein (UPF0127 family)